MAAIRTAFVRRHGGLTDSRIHTLTEYQKEQPGGCCHNFTGGLGNAAGYECQVSQDLLCSEAVVEGEVA